MYGFGGQLNDNRWHIVALLSFALSWFGYNRADAQISSSNPLEYVALAEGNELINAQIKAQIDYDIAGKNIADAQSMRNAIYLALDILKNRKNLATHE